MNLKVQDINSGEIYTCYGFVTVDNILKAICYNSKCKGFEELLAFKLKPLERGPEILNESCTL